MQYSKQNSFFNGYVRDPGPMVFIIAVVGIFAVSVALLCTVPLFDQNDSHDLQQMITQINHIETKENTVYLHTDMGIFAVSNDVINNYTALKNSVTDFVEFQIDYKPLPGNHEVEGSVWELADSKGITYVTEETVREYHKENDRMMAKASWSIVVIYSIFTLFLWYFLSNASKYPRVAALFVRKQWRRF